MSVESPRHAPDTYSRSVAYDERPGEGWMTFAGVMLMLIGVANVIGGIAAIDDANFYIGNAQYIISDLNTWGWVILLTGTAQFLAALGIWTRNQLARWLGVCFAGLNALGQLLMLPAFPLWSLAIFAVDVLIIYGLLAYGSRTATA
jgi:hypothetical protein